MAAQQPARTSPELRARLHSARANVGITPRPGALPDLDCIAKTRREQISGRGAVIGPIRQKSRNRPVELIQKPGQGRAIADVVQRQIRADDLAGCEVQAEV